MTNSKISKIIVWFLASLVLIAFLQSYWSTLEDAVAKPLVRWTVLSTVFGLEIIGYEIIQEDNIIRIGDMRVKITKGCNGLKIIIAFLMFSSLVTLLVKSSCWEKLIVLASSLPIALLCNTIRIIIIMLALTLGNEHWGKIIHDFSGIAVPVGLIAIYTEPWFLKKLTTPPMKKSP
ncbi:exosortase/archaeosortase family protein [Patescibacteria group bacterium]|nr:exosortase/archaeosortase family protein [Patescibacteria group bacterium]